MDKSDLAERAKKVYGRIVALETKLQKFGGRIRLDEFKKRNELRLQLADLYGELFGLSYSLSQKYSIENRCWKNCWYASLEEFRMVVQHVFEVESDNHSSSSSSNPDGESEEEESDLVELEERESERNTRFIILDELKNFLNRGIVFYVNLMTLMVKNHARLGDSKVVNDRQKELLYSFNRTFHQLGDLSRYRTTYILKYGNKSLRSSVNWKESLEMYQKASEFVPQNGKTWHQLALVYRNSGESFQAMYYYVRSLCVKQPYTSARESINVLLEVNRQKYTQDRSNCSFWEKILFFSGCTYGKIGLDQKLFHIMEKFLFPKSKSKELAEVLDTPKLFQLLIMSLFCLSTSKQDDQIAASVYLIFWVLLHMNSNSSESGCPSICHLVVSVLLRWKFEDSQQLWDFVTSSDEYLSQIFKGSADSWSAKQFWTLFSNLVNYCLSDFVPEDESGTMDFLTSDILIRGITYIPVFSSSSHYFDEWMLRLLSDVTSSPISLEQIEDLKESNLIVKRIRSLLIDSSSNDTCPWIYNEDDNTISVKASLKVFVVKSSPKIPIVPIELEETMPILKIEDDLDSESSEGGDDSISNSVSSLLRRRTELEEKLTESSLVKPSTSVREILPDTLLVLDTNEWISHADQIERFVIEQENESLVCDRSLRFTKNLKLGLVTIVFNELRGLENQTTFKGKSENATKAIKCIIHTRPKLKVFSCLGNVIGASVPLTSFHEDLTELFKDLSKKSGVASADDILLSTCRKLTSDHDNVILVTSDRNLRIKAKVDGIKSCDWNRVISILKK